ncbi:MAG: hypothetical protein U0804_19950 [Gemmataceae bacterium]
MLYLSFVPSALLLLAAHAAARRDPHPVRWGTYIFSGFVLTFGPAFLMLVFPVVFLLALLLGAALIAWQVTRHRVHRFLPYSLTALLLAYGFVAWSAWDGYEQMLALRDRYPLESMADRVPAPHPADPRPAADDGLTALENDARTRTGFSLRAYGLQRLHESTTEAFVNSPGFGVTRMVPMPTEQSLKNTPVRPDPPPQPESPGPAWELGDVQFTLPEHDRKAARSLHADGLLDFVNAEGWGYARPDRRAAGFLPHAFSRVPEGREWRAVRVELVGLLKHAEPVVYPSDRLPAMADLKDAPTRAPDAFEAAGVAAIRRGEAGFVGRRGDEVRYVGAVRSAEACVTCHGGERGDLLGAFSYRLRPARVP